LPVCSLPPRIRPHKRPGSRITFFERKPRIGSGDALRLGPGKLDLLPKVVAAAVAASGGSTRFQPVKVATGTATSGKRIPAISFPSESVLGTSAVYLDTGRKQPARLGQRRLDQHNAKNWR
jgi:hypothetical protein